VKVLVALGVTLVALAHQDFWFWDDARLVFGVLPVGLAYHVGYSLLAAAVVWAVVRFAWPARLEEERPPSGA
jgi:hypothetical protein